MAEGKLNSKIHRTQVCTILLLYKHVTYVLLFQTLPCICVYATMIEQDIREFSDVLNTHRLRCNRLSKCPNGIPDDLFMLPQLKGTTAKPSETSYWISFRLFLGARSYLCSADKDVFYAATIIYYTQKSLFYPDKFQDSANALLMLYFGFQQDSISVENCDTVFHVLIQHMHWRCICWELWAISDTLIMN